MIGHAEDIRRGLEAEVRAGARDWAPWLVYADFLTQAGDARGELIGLAHRRVEALERREDGLALTQQLTAQIRELVGRHGSDWRGAELPEGWEARWRCGFIVALRAPFRDETLAALGERLASGQLRLLAELELDTILDEEEWEDDDARYEPGYVPPPMGSDRVTELLTLELGGLRRLGLRYGSLGVESMTELAGCAALAGLRELDLRYNYLSSEALAPLWGAPQLGGLARLHLQHNRLDAEAMVALARAPMARTLERLDLRANALGEAGARALAGAEELAGLSALDLEFSDVGEAGARALAASSYLNPRIRRYWKARCGASHDARA